jgi:predicted acetylornithine/succinylornithine family transaminase
MTPKTLSESPHLFQVFRRQPVLFERGRGAWLWDNRGKKYLDFFSGLAVCTLGHAHPAVTKAVTDQTKKLVHTSNVYFTSPQRDLAKVLAERSQGGRVFLCSSGAEANEGALKIARRHGHLTPAGGQDRFEVIVFDNSFHGRTFGALSATAQKKYQEGFGPLLPGFPVARFGDMASVREKWTPLTCAVLVEPIQGEGGVRRARPEFFQELADFCREKNLLLMFDEVQTGMGRTGALFAYQNPAVVPPGVVPDVIAAAKGLANGLPLGAVIATTRVADLLRAGDHASTFGGGPVICRAGLAVLKVLTPALLNRVRRLGGMFQAEFKKWQLHIPHIKDVRGAGLMWGLELDRPGTDVVAACREAGLLVNCTADKVIRLLPPLILTDAEAKRGLNILRAGLTSR